MGWKSVLNAYADALSVPLRPNVTRLAGSVDGVGLEIFAMATCELQPTSSLHSYVDDAATLGHANGTPSCVG
jgi:hypothetical protein